MIQQLYCLLAFGVVFSVRAQRVQYSNLQHKVDQSRAEKAPPYSNPNQALVTFFFFWLHCAPETDDSPLRPDLT